MTTVEWWSEQDRMRWRVNGCLGATITDEEARTMPPGEFPFAARERVVPLVWLAMPCHDEDRP